MASPAVKLLRIGFEAIELAESEPDLTAEERREISDIVYRAAQLAVTINRRQASY